MSDWITLKVPGADAAVSPSLGAELMSWRVGARELVWHGAQPHWDRRAPILFPIVGRAHEGIVRVDGRAYPMDAHGFARNSAFALTERAADRASFRLVASETTRRHYPFDFALEVTYVLAPTALTLEFTVRNRDVRRLPYALGFHPAFHWPFDGGSQEGHLLVFEKPEDPEVPVIAPGGYFTDERRPLPLAGDTLPLDPALFTEALCLIGAASRAMRFVAPSGRAIAMTVEAFPHLAVWTRPTAPFLSLECWTGHADHVGFAGEISERNSVALLAPGESARHAVTLAFEEPA